MLCWNGRDWERKPGSFKQVECGSSTLVWGVSEGNQAYRWNGSSWDDSFLSLSTVSVGDDGEVWGTNNQNEIFHLQQDKSWQKIEGSLMHIDAAEGNVIVSLY